VQGSEDCQDNWSMSELMHAIVLLAHFHALASFVFGCGVTSETDHPGGHVYVDEHNDLGNVELSSSLNGHTAVAAQVEHVLFTAYHSVHEAFFDRIALIFRLCCCVLPWDGSVTQ